MALSALYDRCDDYVTSIFKAREDLYAAYGKEFVHFLASVYLGVKGFNYSLLSQLTLPVFQSLGVSGNGFQLASMVALTPWSSKGWIGVLSDCFPLGRYHKRGYLLLSSVAGVLGLLGLIAVTYFGATEAYQWWVAVLFMLVHLQAATFDLLSEGKYAEMMRENGAGSEVISLVWMCYNVGSLVSAAAIFIFLSSDGVLPLLAVAMLPALQVTFLSWKGALPEEPARATKYLRRKLFSQPRLFMLACWMVLGVFCINFAAAFGSSWTQVVVTIATTVVLSIASFFALPPVLALSNIYMMLQKALCLDLTGPLSYFYTANVECVPDGPGFSQSYYLGISSMVGALAGGLGSLMFHWISNWSFARAFQLTTFVQIVASVSDIVIIKRWNKAVGLSDQATYLLGDGAIQQLTLMLSLMPAVLLTSRLCPRGAEATVYSILAGFQNFGGQIASVLGVTLADRMDIITTGAVQKGAECNFEKLSLAVIIAHMALPCICIPLANWMVPTVAMDNEAYWRQSAPPPSFMSPASSSAFTPSPGRFISTPTDEDSEGSGDDDSGYRRLSGSPRTASKGNPAECDFVLTGLRQVSSSDEVTQ